MPDSSTIPTMIDREKAAAAAAREQAAARYRVLLVEPSLDEADERELLRLAGELGRSGDQIASDATLVSRLAAVQPIAGEFEARQIAHKATKSRCRELVGERAAVLAEQDTRLKSADAQEHAAMAALSEAGNAKTELRSREDAWGALVANVTIDEYRAARRRGAL